MTSAPAAPGALSTTPGLPQVTLPGAHRGPSQGLPFPGDTEELKPLQMVFDEAAGPQFSAQCRFGPR